MLSCFTCSYDSLVSRVSCFSRVLVTHALSCVKYIVPYGLSCPTRLVLYVLSSSLTSCPACFCISCASCLTCSRALLVLYPMRSPASRTLVTNVPRAIRAIVPYVPRAVRALVYHVLRALCALARLMCSCTSRDMCLACSHAPPFSRPRCFCTPHRSLISGVSSLICLYVSHVL